MIDWKDAPHDAQYYCTDGWSKNNQMGSFYKKDITGNWYVYRPARGWEYIQYNPENFSWWGNATTRPIEGNFTVLQDIIKERLDSFLEDAQYNYENFTSEGLTFGSIEAEGYLRAVKQIRNEIHELIKFSEDLK